MEAAALAVGTKVTARAKDRFWYSAEIMDERGDDEREFHVFFLDYPKSHMEWLRPADIRSKMGKTQIVQLNVLVKYPTTQGHDAATNTWTVNKIIGKKGKGSNASTLRPPVSGSIFEDLLRVEENR